MPARSSSDMLRAALRRLSSSGLLLLLLLPRRLFANSIRLEQIFRPPARRTRHASTCKSSHSPVMPQKGDSELTLL